MNKTPQTTTKADAPAEARKSEQRKQRGLWQRRHNLNVVERETFVKLNRKYGTYTGPKQEAAQ